MKPPDASAGDDPDHVHVGFGSEASSGTRDVAVLEPGQHRVRSAIIEAVEKYGIPRVVDEQDRLRVRLDSGREVQTLFAIGHTALSSRLAGVMVYTRLDEETIFLLHMAVVRDYASGARFGRQMLALRLVERLRKIAGQVKGVRAVRLILGSGKFWDAAV